MTLPGLRGLPRPVAVVVGGGGVLGAAHVGVGYALEQRGFVPDLVVGTSVGALTGAIARHRGWTTSGPTCAVVTSFRSATARRGQVSSPTADCAD